MPIIRRYETLSISRQDLLQQLNSLTDELKTSQNQLEALKHQHNTFKLVQSEHYGFVTAAHWSLTHV